MKVFSLLSRFRKREPVKRPKAKPRPKKKASIVFIDMPNIFAPNNQQQLVRWNKVRRIIKHLTKGTTRRFSGAYFEKKSATIKVKSIDLRKDFEQNGYRYFSYDKSVDIVIGSDLWEQIILAIASDRVSRLRIILVSGDNDFARPLKGIRETLGKVISLEIIVLAWQESAGKKLKLVADRVIYLNYHRIRTSFRKKRADSS